MPVGTPNYLGNQSGSTLVLTGNANLGDLVALFIAVQSSNSTGAIASVTDTQGQIYQRTFTTGYLVGLPTLSVDVWQRPNSVALVSGTDAIIISTTGTVGSSNISGTSTSGCDPATPFDQSAISQGTGNNPMVTTSALAQANEIAFGYTAWGSLGTSYSSDPTFTNLQLSPTGLDYLLTPNPSPVTYAPTLFGTSPLYLSLVATFQGPLINKPPLDNLGQNIVKLRSPGW